MGNTLTEQGRQLAKEYGLVISVANTVLSPGKFEGEHVSTLVFWEAYLNGCGWDTAEGIVFDLTDQETDELGNNSPVYILCVDNNGFVRGNTYVSPTTLGYDTIAR